MSDQGVFLSKWPPNWRIILAKEQLGHSYIFWTMPILIFCQFANFGNQSLFVKKYPLQDLLSSLNAVISTNERNWILTGHVIFKLRYNQIYQLKTNMGLRNQVYSIPVYNFKSNSARSALRYIIIPLKVCIVCTLHHKMARWKICHSMNKKLLGWICFEVKASKESSRTCDYFISLKM